MARIRVQAVLHPPRPQVQRGAVSSRSEVPAHPALLALLLRSLSISHSFLPSSSSLRSKCRVCARKATFGQDGSGTPLAVRLRARYPPTCYCLRRARSGLRARYAMTGIDGGSGGQGRRMLSFARGTSGLSTATSSA
eukprot:1235269-Rhodomonas_salina.2